jgi:hypothetical protein
VRPVSTIVSTASAICSAGISGKLASAKYFLASSVRMFVSVMPGLTVFAVMPSGPRVGATLRMNPTTACFVRSYTGSGGNGMSPASELVAMIEPPPRRVIERIAARVP